MTCWKQYSIYVGWFLNTSSWKPWQRTSIRVDNCRIGIHIWDQHFLLMFRLGSNWYQQTSYRCFRVSKNPPHRRMLTSDFFPHISHGWFLDPISTLEIQRSSAPKQPLDSAESLHLDVWVIFFGRSIFFCCYLFSQSHLGKDDWMMITLIDHLITKPLMFCLDRDGWTHTLQHAFRKFQSGFFVLALSLNYLKHLLILYNRCISVGTRKGYSLTNCDPFGRVYTMSACSFKNFSYIRSKHAIQMMVPEG